MTIEPVTRVLDAAGITYALIGAHAMAARGYPRFTIDIDRRRGDDDEHELVARAEAMTVLGVTIGVPATSDLILLKLAAGGHLDLHDAAVLLELEERERIVAEVEARLDDVRPDVRSRWRDLLGRWIRRARPVARGARRRRPPGRCRAAGERRRPRPSRAGRP